MPVTQIVLGAENATVSVVEAVSMKVTVPARVLARPLARKPVV
jgi:hypothetical protein